MNLYDAFISYSHAKDKPIAAALQSAVQKLGKPWYRRRALRLFRDDTSLSATPHLWPTIEQALGQSRFFLLLASPEAAASKWVNKEVSYWLEHNSINTVLIGLTDGELNWDEAVGDFSARERHPLPPALAKRFENEPKWVDLCPYRAGASKRDAKFTELAADFAATIRGMLKEDLLSQEVRQQRRTLKLAGSAAALLIVLSLGAAAAGLAAYRQERNAEQVYAVTMGAATDVLHDLIRRMRNTPGIPVTSIKEPLEQAILLQANLLNAGSYRSAHEGRVWINIVKSYDEAARLLLNIGDTEGAKSDALMAANLLVDLVYAHPQNAEYRRLLCEANILRGDIGLAQGNLHDAQQSYQDSFFHAEELADSDAGNAGWQHELVQRYITLADAYRRSNDRDNALYAVRHAKAVMEWLTKLSPDNADWRNELTLLNDKIAALTK